MKIKVLLVALSLLLSVPASAHSGGTDSQGGHHDYNNVSGLGSYHYHHGMGPHLHPNGVCPYASGNSGGSYTEPEIDPLDGFEYDEDRNIYYGEWGIIDEDGYFHSYEDGVFDEDGNFYLYDELEWCIYCDGTVYPGRDHECPAYEDAPDYCYDCDNVIESSSDHDEDCPVLAPKYDFAAPTYSEEEAESIIQEAIGANARESVKTDSETWLLLAVCAGLPAAAFIGYKAGKKH